MGMANRDAVWQWAAHLIEGKITLKRVVKKASVHDRDQGASLDMWRELKISVRLFDVPLLLELGGRLAIVWGWESVIQDQ